MHPPLPEGPLAHHPVWRWWPYTAALHGLLPVAVAALGATLGPLAAGQALLALHGLTAIGAVVSLPWWWRHLPSVFALVLANHLVTAGVVAVLVALLGG